MKKTLFLVSIAAMLYVSCKKDDTTTTTTTTTTDTLGSSDRNFLNNAAYINENELAIAQLVADSTKNDTLRTYANKLIADYTLSSHALDSLNMKNTQWDYTLPTTADSAHTTYMTTLRGLSGESFDSSYLVNEISGDSLSISGYQNEISYGSNQGLVNYATTYLPAIQSDQTSAATLQNE